MGKAVEDHHESLAFCVKMIGAGRQPFFQVLRIGVANVQRAHRPGIAAVQIAHQRLGNLEGVETARRAVLGGQKVVVPDHRDAVLFQFGEKVAQVSALAHARPPGQDMAALTLRADRCEQLFVEGGVGQDIVRWDDELLRHRLQLPPEPALPNRPKLDQTAGLRRVLPPRPGTQRILQRKKTFLRPAQVHESHPQTVLLRGRIGLVEMKAKP